MKNVKIRFGGADTRSIKTLNSFPHGLFISELVDNRDPEIHAFLRRTNFGNGSSIFGRRSPEEMQDFRDVCNGSLNNSSDEEVAGIIQYYVQRIRNYGHIESMQQGRIKQARIVPIDIPRTKVCEFYEGKLISVEVAYNQVKHFQTLTPEQYYKEISTKEFEIPPFYRFCRCRFKAIIPGVDNSYEKYKI